MVPKRDDGEGKEVVPSETSMRGSDQVEVRLLGVGPIPSTLIGRVAHSAACLDVTPPSWRSLPHDAYGMRNPLANSQIGRTRNSYNPPGASMSSPGPLSTSMAPRRSSGTVRNSRA
jgi:hypothetical protein